MERYVQLQLVSRYGPIVVELRDGSTASLVDYIARLPKPIGAEALRELCQLVQQLELLAYLEPSQSTIPNQSDPPSTT